MQSPKSPKKRVNIHHIRSREELLSEQVSSDSCLSRTKIICSINEKTTEYEIIKKMVLAGADSLSVNSAYIQSRKQLKKISHIRNDLEKELGRTISLNLILKGNLTRVGELSKPEVFLQRHQLIRLTSCTKIVGDENLISIDQEDFFERVKTGDQIFIDYGQVVLKVVGQESYEEAIQCLQEMSPGRYKDSLFMRQNQNINQSNVSNPNSDNQEENLNSQYDSDLQLDFQTSSIQSPPQLIHLQSQEQQAHKSSSQKKIKYTEALRDYKSKKILLHKIIVCEVINECLMRAFKPVYLYSVVNHQFEIKSKLNDKQDPNWRIVERNEDSDEDDSISHITVRDINDVSYAQKFDFDQITISGITRPEDVQELRSIIGPGSKDIKIYVRITRKAAVDNFEKIIKEADGCIIARAYIAIETPVEDVIKQQYEMIQICRRLLKPVVISTQVLESMLTSLVPSFTEMGDISNVVRQSIDGIALSSETTYGNHPIQVITALRRACKIVENTEQKEKLMNCQVKFSLQEYEPYKKLSVSTVLAHSAVESAFKLAASLIVVFTSTGLTAVKLSKLRPSCQVLAVTSSKKVCRFLNTVGAVIPMFFGSLYGTEALVKKVLDQATEAGWVKSKDYVVVLRGNYENISGHIDTMQVIQV